ncbi:MAG: S41 family peptidase [Sphingobacterium sp.]
MKHLLANFYNSIIIVFLFAIPLFSSAQSSRQKAERLLSFAKAAGAIQFFSPTDAVHQTRWNKIYINGVRAVCNVKNDRAFADTLINIFKPIEPSLLLIYQKDTLSLPKVTNERGQLVISKQNLGLDLLTGSNRSFRSIRLNRRSLISDVDMFNIPLMAKSIRSTDTPKNGNIRYSYKYHIEKPLEIEVLRDGKVLSKVDLSPEDSIFFIHDTVSAVNFNIVQELRLDENLKLNWLSDDIIFGDKLYKHEDLKEPLDSAKTVNYTIKIFGDDFPLYKESFGIGDSLSLILKNNIKISFPLAVYGDKVNTFPIADALSGNYIYKKSKFGNYNQIDDLNELTVRIANIIEIWNVFRLAYVYNPFNQSQQDKLLIETIERAFQDKNVDDYHTTVWNMLSKYADSHIFLSMNAYNGKFDYTPPITVIPLKKKMFVKLVHDSALKNLIHPGDEIIAVDGEPIKDIVQSQLEKTTGSPQNRMIHVAFDFLAGPKDTPISLKVKNYKTRKVKIIKINRNYQEKNIYFGTSFTKFRKACYLSPNVFYFDITRDKFTDSLKNLMNDSNMNIIFDLRGYFSDLNAETSIISNMITDTIMTKNIFTNHIMGPDRREFVPKKIVYKPESKNHKAKFYFLVDASTQSAPETLLDLVKFAKVGKIIGQPTAGANGNINMLYLSGGMAVTFSGVLVKNADGSKHHLKGVTPDYKVSYKIKDIIAENDPYLEKALEIIQTESRKTK